MYITSSNIPEPWLQGDKLNCKLIISDFKVTQWFFHCETDSSSQNAVSRKVKKLLSVNSNSILTTIKKAELLLIHKKYRNAGFGTGAS